jgi:hypothetical protein
MRLNAYQEWLAGFSELSGLSIFANQINGNWPKRISDIWPICLTKCIMYLMEDSRVTNSNVKKVSMGHQRGTNIYDQQEEESRRCIRCFNVKKLKIMCKRGDLVYQCKHVVEHGFGSSLTRNPIEIQ